MRSPGTLAVLVVGTDTVIQALPARPIQLAHACGEFGFDLVVPLSWGDELVAQAALTALSSRPASAAVLCACPVVRQRLLQSENTLGHAMVSLVSPPVAAARYLRSKLGPKLGLIVFAGLCPSARPPEYDRSLEPRELLAVLRRRGIEIEAQPDVFTDRLPPDRRRFASLPGGCPAPEVLWRSCNERVLVELEGHDLAIDLAQLLISPGSWLVDPAAALGCSCSGVTHSSVGPAARLAVMSLEPPRSPAPIFESPVGADIELPEPVLAPQSADLIGDRLVHPPSNEGPPRPPMAVTPRSALRFTP